MSAGVRATDVVLSLERMSRSRTQQSLDADRRVVVIASSTPTVDASYRPLRINDLRSGRLVRTANKKRQVIQWRFTKAKAHKSMGYQH